MPRSPFDYEEFGRKQAEAQARELMNVLRARLQEVAAKRNAAEEAATVMSSEDEGRSSEQNSSAVSPPAVPPLDRAILEPPLQPPDAPASTRSSRANTPLPSHSKPGSSQMPSQTPLPSHSKPGSSQMPSQASPRGSVRAPSPLPKPSSRPPSRPSAPASRLTSRVPSPMPSKRSVPSMPASPRNSRSRAPSGDSDRPDWGGSNDDKNGDGDVSVTEEEEEEDEEDPPRAPTPQQRKRRETWGMSRNGPPCRALIRRDDGSGLFVLSAHQSLEAFTKLFECRNRQLKIAGRPLNAYLPKANQLAAQKALEKEWWATDLGKEIWMDCHEEWGWSKSLVKRNAATYYRRAQYEDYGGREWCFILIAIGHIDNAVVDIVNEIIQQRKARGRQRPPPMKHASKGIHHKTSHAKQARQEAQRAQTYADKYPKKQWLQEEATRAWDHAEKISREAGIPLKGRNGNLVEGIHKTLVTEVLLMYCERKGVKYE